MDGIGLLRWVIWILPVTTQLMSHTVYGWTEKLTATHLDQTFTSQPIGNSGNNTQNIIHIEADPTEPNTLVRCQISSTYQLSPSSCANGAISVFSGRLFLGSYCGQFENDTFLASDTSMSIVVNVSGLAADMLLTVVYSTTKYCAAAIFATTSPRYVRTPGYPISTLPENERIKSCLWRLKAPESNRVRMNLKYSLSGYQPDCNKTKVTVYGAIYELLLDTSRDISWCGGDDHLFASYSNNSLIRSAGQAHLQHGVEVEFVAEPVDTCYKEIIVAENSTGTISSEGYPGHIEELQICKWHLTTNSTTMRVFRLTMLDSNLADTVGCTKDSIRVYSTSDHKSPLLALWCGTEKPDVEFFTTGLMIEFRTGVNHSTIHSGFQMRYESRKESVLCMEERNASVQLETLTSPNYPAPFPSFKKYVWKLTSTEPTHVVKIKVIKSDFGSSSNFFCPSGYLQVYEGPEEVPSKLMRQWCTDGEWTFQSKVRHLLVVFVSKNNAAQRKGVVIGFWRGQYGVEVKWPFIPRSVSFPADPGDYTSGYDVFWNISTLLNYHVGVRFTNVNVSCPRDAITVYDGGLGPGYRYWSMCGTYNRSYFSSARKLFVRFRTFTNKGTGFTLYYRSHNYKGCGANVQEVTAASLGKYLYSPGHPYNYFDQLRCDWRFKSLGDRIKLVIEVFDIVTNSETFCPSDYLQVYEGYYTSGKKHPRICGKSRTQDIESAGKYLYVEFRTDMINTGKGFRIKYSSVSDRVDVGYDPNYNTTAILIGAITTAVLVLAICIVLVVVKKRKGNPPPVMTRMSGADSTQVSHMSVPYRTGTFEPPPSYSEVENLPPEVKNDVSLPTYTEAVSEGMVQDGQTETGQQVTSL